jgi:hypothetical protein
MADPSGRREVTAMKLLTALVGAALALLAVGVVSAASSHTSTADATKLVIRHAAVGCHDWSLGGGSFGTSHYLLLRQGQSFTVENRDNCGHELVQTSGPLHASMLNAATGTAASGVLKSLQPGVRVVLDKVGTYVFTTAERDDLEYGADTDMRFGFAKLASSGPDNTLTLVVRVIPDHNHAVD